MNPDTRKELNESLDQIQEKLEELNGMDWERFSIYPKISNAIYRVKDLKKALNTPEKPDTCSGFIGDCDRKPSKYSDLHDAWYCIPCWNERYYHYAT